MFYPPPSVRGICGLLRRGCPRHCRCWALALIGLGLHASTFLRPLAPRALPRFVATTDALTPIGRLFGLCGHERRSGPGGSPCLPRPHFQPFCPQPPHHPDHGICVCSAFLSARGRTPEDPVRGCGRRDAFPHGSWHRLRTALAGSPVGVAESGLLCVILSCHVITDGLFTSGSSPPRVATTQ
jgi:hypothetical protein